jgi:hypothetical protein
MSEEGWGLAKEEVDDSLRCSYVRADGSDKDSYAIHQIDQRGVRLINLTLISYERVSHEDFDKLFVRKYPKPMPEPERRW